MEASRNHPRTLYGRLYQRWLYPGFDRLIKKRKTIDYWRRAEVTQWWSREKLEELQLCALRTLLHHAWETCAFYREHWSERGLYPSQLHSLADFRQWPLLDRDTFRAESSRIRSSAAMRRVTKTTGGSTGAPLRFELNDDSNQRRTAITHRGYAWAGAAPGRKQLHVWGRTIGPVPLTKRIKTVLHHRFDHQRYLSCFEHGAEQMQQHFRVMNRYRPEVIVAYSNSLYEFARYLSRRSLVPYSPNAIVLGAEKVYDHQRELIEKVFRCPVFETYGSREVMLIGAECERHEGLHLSAENLLVEVLDDHGNPTPDGEEGNIAVTDLFNLAMPFIRYLNGDRAIAGFTQCPCGRGLPILRGVVGRQADMLYSSEGQLVPGLFFPHLLKDFASVERFQVVQDRDQMIRLRLKVDENFQEEDSRRLITEVRRCIGEQARFELEFVDHIELTAMGKHRVVVRAAQLSRELIG